MHIVYTVSLFWAGERPKLSAEEIMPFISNEATFDMREREREREPLPKPFPCPQTAPQYI